MLRTFNFTSTLSRSSNDSVFGFVLRFMVLSAPSTADGISCPRRSGGKEVRRLSARHKLNVAFVNGALIVAGVVGMAFRSWLVFLIVAVVLVVGAIYAGDVRQRPRR